MTTRLRIAPSPTGSMHVGTGRTALFNWLFARHTGGTFIVRIDDTDDERSAPLFEADILDGLRWLGLQWDEGVAIGGPHGSYRQSDRYPRYREAAEVLVAEGAAYPCFCTPAELDERRKQAEAAGRPPGYDGRCRTIEQSVAAARLAAGETAAIRLAITRPGATEFSDLIRGEIRVDHDNLDDFVLLRSNGRPTYHLASTVDDVDYEITHVARGEDLLPSTPRHIQLTLALGAEVPIYAHFPLIRGTDGKRLSKRHGAKAVIEYREAGYLPEALANYLCLLGWSPGEDLTVFPLSLAIERFELTAVSKNPAVFDIAKLDWMNGEHVRALPSEEFMARARPFIEAGLGHELTPEQWGRFAEMAPLIQERTKLLSEIAGQVRFLFVDEVEFDDDSWNKVMSPEAAPVLDAAVARLTELRDWSTAEIEATLRSMLEELGLNARKGLQPLRVAITGSTVSPPLFESMAVLGWEATLRRLTEVRRRLAG
ncbi:MAG TPA: glutamate--tRNA ligase [Acidimicrobiia bacterium]|nr:glutamate--tRNA ligase [Acidimicrobiia bacterium]